MTDGLPLTHFYNLARLGQAGDKVEFAASDAERAAIARWSGIAAVEALSAKVEIRKLSPARFALDIDLAAEVIQSCVVTLEPVPARIARRFTRELHFAGPARRGAKPADPETVTLDGSGLAGPDDDEPAEEIDNLQYDLARPVLEEYVLSLDPYPRVKGAEFGLKPGSEPPLESPFAVLKGTKPAP